VKARTPLTGKAAFAGEVNFAGTGGNNKANIGNVTLDKTRHITTEAGSGNALTFTDTTVTVRRLARWQR
jgi:fibronectin-binding autotransporter adhesin